MNCESQEVLFRPGWKSSHVNEHPLWATWTTPIPADLWNSQPAPSPSMRPVLLPAVLPPRTRRLHRGSYCGQIFLPFLLCFVLVITEQAMVMLCTCHNRLSEQCFPILLTGKWRQKKSEWDKSLVVSAPACAELAACSLRPALAGCRAPPSQPPLPRAPQSAPVRELTRRYSPSSSPLKHSVISINIKNPVTT